jgi:hypothetical protein
MIGLCGPLTVADWLRKLVAEPLSRLASAAGLSGPLPAVGVGITANFVTAPLTSSRSEPGRGAVRSR